MKEKIIEIIKEFNEDILNYEGSNLFDSGVIDSLQAVSLIGEFEDQLDIEIDAEYVTEENLKTPDAIIEMVLKILEA